MCTRITDTIHVAYALTHMQNRHTPHKIAKSRGQPRVRKFLRHGRTSSSQHVAHPKIFPTVDCVIAHSAWFLQIDLQVHMQVHVPVKVLVNLFENRLQNLRTVGCSGE